MNKACSNRSNDAMQGVNSIPAKAYLELVSKPKSGNRGAHKHRGADGELYDSDIEELMIAQLRQLERAGKILNLERQVRFDLHAKGGEYVGFSKVDASFFDVEQNRQRWVDAKSDRIWDTALSDWKFKHIKQEYGVIVEIIRPRAKRKSGKRRAS